MSLGQSNEALKHYEQILKQRIDIFGNQHPDTLTSINNMAYCLDSLGFSTEALPYYHKAYTLRNEILGNAHPEALVSRNGLASCLVKLGRYFEALQHYEEILRLRLDVLGELHPYTLNSLNNLAMCLYRIGREEDSLKYLEKSCNSRLKIHTRSHPNSLRSLSNLALCLDKIGNYHEAISIIEPTLQELEKTLGKYHPDTLTGFSNYASILDNAGRMEEAMTVHEKTLALRVEALGEYHPESLTSLNNLAVFLDRLNSRHNRSRTPEITKRITQLVSRMTSKPQLGDTWMLCLKNAIDLVITYVNLNEMPNWQCCLESLDKSVREILDLQDPRQLQASRSTVTYFYWSYINLCLTHHLEKIPEVVCGLQGRKLAALALEEFDQKCDKSNPLPGHYNESRRRLRVLSLGLRSGDGVQAPQELKLAEPNADALTARQRAQWLAYEAEWAEYHDLRVEMTNKDSGFAHVAKVLKPSLAGLQADLAADIALVILIYREGESAKLHAYIVRHANVACFDLPLYLSRLCDGVKKYSATYRKVEALREARLQFPDEDEATEEPGRLDHWDLPTIEAELAEYFWKPLRSALPDVREVHLASHGPTHILPFELGCPPEWTLHTYPGFVHYLLSKQDPVWPWVPGDVALGLQVYDAEEEKLAEENQFNPIPYVNAEAQLVERLWQGTGETHIPFAFDSEDPAVAWAHWAMHGEVAGDDPGQARLVYGPGHRVGSHELMASRLRLDGAFISSCLLGRTQDDPDGDPLGLLTALFLRGTRYAIAALQPISDEYMPLLVCLFYQSWNRQGGHPSRALAEAKRRMLAGDWYEDTEALIREAYVVVGDKAEPKPAAFVETLCANRAYLPPEAVALCAWVRGFGRGG